MKKIIKNKLFKNFFYTKFPSKIDNVRVWVGLHSGIQIGVWIRIKLGQISGSGSKLGPGSISNYVEFQDQDTKSMYLDPLPSILLTATRHTVPRLRFNSIRTQEQDDDNKPLSLTTDLDLEAQNPASPTNQALTQIPAHHSFNNKYYATANPRLKG